MDCSITIWPQLSTVGYGRTKIRLPQGPQYSVNLPTALNNRNLHL